VSNRPFRVTVTGPESTGKTTLAQRLAESLGTEWVPEASRVYAERLAREPTSSDVEPIARAHMVLADAAADRVRARQGKVLVLDTDLVSTVVYARHYYAWSSEWLEREERARRADLSLLCDVDVPWISDGIRDRPTNRDAMFAQFRDALERRAAHTIVIRGDWESRWTSAREAVVQLLASERDPRSHG
jgi:NadR type nicotinamide-nucleotide adenylyltransferase